MEMNRVDISVIVPIYNVEKYVERCLRSLFTQSKTDGVEFLLINDATPDNSMEVVRRVVAEFPKLNINIVENERNRGLYATRCIGVAVAKGEYIQHIDSDDWVEPTMLAELWDEVEQTKAEIIACDYIQDYRGTTKMIGFKGLANNGPGCLYVLLGKGMLGSLCFKMVKKELYARAGVKLIEGLNMCEDLLFSIRLYAAAKNVSHLKRAFYHYDRSNEASLTAQFDASSRQDLVRIESEIDSVLNEFNVKTQQIEQIMTMRRFEVCRKLFIYADDEELASVVAIYPEIVSQIWSAKGVPFKQRIALWAASKGQLWFTKLLFCTSRRKVRRNRK